jgi:hypothetical protein
MYEQKNKQLTSWSITCFTIINVNSYLLGAQLYVLQ